MQDIFVWLNQPTILWMLLVSAVVAILVDYFLPVDWVAFLGYGLFSLFVGATVPATPTISLGLTGSLLLIMWALHYSVFRHYLTNAFDGRQPPVGSHRAVL
ncbi:MAG: hypothetical protein KatS3mg111_2692 [Pirellulaceae bacterium]|nr:MAG: hypothetical protein KatS3mg111_2692 [Pirellulaceae bacterium]